MKIFIREWVHLVVSLLEPVRGHLIKHVEDKLNPLSWNETRKNSQVNGKSIFLLMAIFSCMFCFSCNLRPDWLVYVIFFSIDEQKLISAFQIHTTSDLSIYFRYETPVITFICHFSTTAKSVISCSFWFRYRARR